MFTILSSRRKLLKGVKKNGRFRMISSSFELIEKPKNRINTGIDRTV